MGRFLGVHNCCRDVNRDVFCLDPRLMTLIVSRPMISWSTASGACRGNVCLREKELILISLLFQFVNGSKARNTDSY